MFVTSSETVPLPGSHKMFIDAPMPELSTHLRNASLASSGSLSPMVGGKSPVVQFSGSGPNFNSNDPPDRNTCSRSTQL
ncbi:hypothetical protein J3459_016391 [Metarhizium acridum]|nr:hypothetical protein J3459_016391 [Metarhizium acridum]